MAKLLWMPKQADASKTGYSPVPNRSYMWFCDLCLPRGLARHHPGSAGVYRSFLRLCFGLLVFLMSSLSFGAIASAHEISEFFGRYSGSVEVTYADGHVGLRDMSVEISETRKGFRVKWSSTTEKRDGRRKEKTYEIDFVASDRDGIFSAEMHRNVFGHGVQHDPMKGQPYVWARISGETLTVFSMFIHPNGDYEMQQYDRTLTSNGLHLVFSSHRNGHPLRQLTTELTRH